MPPKRKRVDDAKQAEPATATRSTRSSTRKAATAKTTAKTATANAANSAIPDSEPAPPVKKTKTTKASKATSSSKAKTDTKRKAVPQVKDDVVPQSTQRLNLEDASPSTNGTAVVMAATGDAMPKFEAYSAAKALATFGKYTDEDDPEAIGPESFARLCEEANIPMEGPQPLIVAWQMAAAEMGKITKEEWAKGAEKLRIVSLHQLAIVASDLDKMLIQGQPPLTKTATRGKRSDEPYDRTSYWQLSADPKAAFQSLFTYCFTLAKPPQARNIDMETATALWTVLLSPQYPIIEEIVKFINERGSYKGVNKDLWSMTLDFCKTVKPDLSGYEADGAWPTMLDEFVAWTKENTTT